MAEAFILWSEHEDRLALAAFAKADAWARSVKGTPYGVTEAVTTEPRSGKSPAPLDQRVMAKVHGRSAE